MRPSLHTPTGRFALGSYLAESILPTRAATLAAMISDFDHATSRQLKSRARMLKGLLGEVKSGWRVSRRFSPQESENLRAISAGCSSRLGNSWAGPISAVTFAVAMMVLDRSGGVVG